MFIDKVKLNISSGKGGEGCTSFRREKFVVKGGPDGGDGGRGGYVFFEVNSNTDTLSSFKGKKYIKADDGKPGEGNRSSGKSGEHLIIKVPPGTQVIDDKTDKILLDLIKENEKISFLIGGKGGLGNYHFKNSRNQTPTYHQMGLPGISIDVRLELKLIADVGLVGYPNVGKSTFISVLSNAKPEIANYEFTTLTPKLGVVNVDEYSSFVMADIPGIIKGANKGKGLGLEFLKHIERTKILLFIVDVSNYRDIFEQYTTLREELRLFSPKLFLRKHAVVLAKADSFSSESINTKTKDFLKRLNLKNTNNNIYNFNDEYYYFLQNKEKIDFIYDNSLPFFITPISSMTNLNTKAVKYSLYDMRKIDD